MARDDRLLDRAIDSIDMRLPGIITAHLSPEGVAASAVSRPPSPTAPSLSSGVAPPVGHGV
jgi:hypothetical protein